MDRRSLRPTNDIQRHGLMCAAAQAFDFELKVAGIECVTQRRIREVAKAEQRFTELTGAGFTAAVRSGPGEQRIIRSFDPTAEETLFYPRLVGG
jgi:hypothetical protein